ncbi:MAG: flagellin, partial [Lachnospira eligens]|nr:flagellin [Lachnospira eligens]
MVVQHNLSAMNTNRQMGTVSSALQKSTEKLSSGYKINRAGDDAAGLSISEKMRSQIRGLNKASSNAEDGISLIQVAEGALNETHSILQRMNELATQAANDTNTSTDRKAIQQELNQLTSELDRIYSTTQFNTMNLLDGSFSKKSLQVGSLSGQVIAISIGKMDAKSLGISAASVKVSTNAVAGKSMTII